MPGFVLTRMSISAIIKRVSDEENPARPGFPMIAFKKRRFIMSNLVRVLVVITIATLASSPSVAAERCSGQEEQKKTMEQEIQQLRSELTSMREELKLLQTDIRKVLTELRGIKSSVAAKATPTPKPKGQPDTKVYNIELGSSPIRGAKDALVTIVEFADFQCPYCAREWPKLQQLLEQYPDKVRVVVKHFPLSFHKKAKPAHAAAEFANRTAGAEAFWKMHDMILKDYRKLDVPTLRGYAESLGLDLAKFDKLMADPNEINAMVKSDMDEARKCGVRGTPTVLVNGLKMARRDMNSYTARVDEILKTADKGKPAAKAGK